MYEERGMNEARRDEFFQRMRSECTLTLIPPAELGELTADEISVFRIELLQKKWKERGPAHTDTVSQLSIT